MTLLERLRAERDAARSAMIGIHESAGENPFSDEQNAEFERHAAIVAEREAQIAREETRAAFADSLSSRSNPEVRTESGSIREPEERFSGDIQVIVRQDPFEALNESRMRSFGPRDRERALVSANLSAIEGRNLGGAANEAHFERILKRHARDTKWSSNLLARQRPEYESGFEKYVTGRDMFLDPEERAAMAVGTNTAGGFLVPTHLDPSLIITNSGTSNMMRSLARNVTLTEGSVWNGVTTAGSTASWDGELVEVSDDTPAVGRVSITTYKAQSLVQASIEATQDISGLSGDLLMLLGDSRDRLEGTAHMTGSGSSQPFGIFTAIDATAGSELQTATAATLAAADLGRVYTGVPVRWRSRSQWLMHPLFNMAIKNLGTAVSASYSGDLREAPADRIYGKQVNESDDAPSAWTSTTQLENVLIFGDFSNYIIVDKPGSVSIEYIPHLFNTSNNLPDGRRAWYMYWRTGADSVNDAAFRLLQDKTSA